MRLDHIILPYSDLLIMPGDYGGGGIPVPIPNTEVKPSNADDTASLKGGKVGRCQAFFILLPGVYPWFFHFKACRNIIRML